MHVAAEAAETGYYHRFLRMTAVLFCHGEQQTMSVFKSVCGTAARSQPFFQLGLAVHCCLLYQLATSATNPKQSACKQTSVLVAVVLYLFAAAIRS